MKAKSTEKLLGDIKRSKLLDEQELKRAIEVIKEAYGGTLPDDPHQAAQSLVDSDLLTEWQAEKLLEGRFKGFFLGKYKLLGCDEPAHTYVAEDTNEGKIVHITLKPTKRGVIEPVVDGGKVPLNRLNWNRD